MNEEQNIGITERDRETEQGTWQYVETPLAAEVRAGNIVLRPHWKGAIDSNEIRRVVRLASAAPTLLSACQAMQKSLNGSAGDFAGMLAAHRQLDAAVALVAGPADESAKRPTEISNCQCGERY